MLRKREVAVRPGRITATAATAVAAVAVIAAVTGCTAHSTPVRPAATAPAAPAGPQATTPPPVAKVPSPTGGTGREPAVLADGRHPVFLKGVDAGRRRVTFDLIQFYQGDAATIEAAKDHQESPPPNDHYVRNVNPRLRTLWVRRDAPVTVNALLGTQQPVPVTLAKLATLTRTSSPVFWVSVRDDQVVRINEQWLP
jgi:hypothetical protein